MANVQRPKGLTTSSVIILLAGIWTIIAAYALGNAGGVQWSGTIVGILMIICSLGRLAAPQARGYSAANIIWSIWLIISPWAMPASVSIHWSNDITGVIALIAAIVALRERLIMALPQTGYGPTQRAA